MDMSLVINFHNWIWKNSECFLAGAAAIIVPKLLNRP